MSIFCAIKDCLSSLVENGELDTAKLCLMEDGLNGNCPVTVPPLGLDKDNNTLTLEGNVVANFPLGQNINLQDANNAVIGSAVSAGGATYDETNDVTVIPITDCELDEGKTADQVVKAKAVTKLVQQATLTVKKFESRLAVKTVKK